MKHVLIISSSGRKGGNSDLLCDQFANFRQEAWLALSNGPLWRRRLAVGGYAVKRLSGYAAILMGVIIVIDGNGVNGVIESCWTLMDIGGRLRLAARRWWAIFCARWRKRALSGGPDGHFVAPACHKPFSFRHLRARYMGVCRNAARRRGECYPGISPSLRSNNPAGEMADAPRRRAK